MSRTLLSLLLLASFLAAQDSARDAYKRGRMMRGEKQKQFAAGVDRSIIEKGAEMLGVELGELITDTIMGMRDVAEEIGLKGKVE